MPCASALCVSTMFHLPCPCFLHHSDCDSACVKARLNGTDSNNKQRVASARGSGTPDSFFVCFLPLSLHALRFFHAGPRSLLFFCLHLAFFHPDQITDVCPCVLSFPHCSFQQPCRAHRQDLTQQQRGCRHKLEKNNVKNVNKDHQLMRSRCHRRLRQRRQLVMRQRRNSLGPHRQVYSVPELWNQNRDLEKPLSSCSRNRRNLVGPFVRCASRQWRLSLSTCRLN